MTVGLVLDEAIGAGADVVLDGSLTGRLDDLFRVDRRRIVRMGEAYEQGWHRLLQVDDDGVRILRLDPLQVLRHGFATTGQLAPMLEGRHDVCGRHLLAVVELHPTPELERVCPSPVADGVPLGQHRDGLVSLVVGVERLVDVPGNLLGDHRRGGVQIEGRRLTDHGRLEHPTRLGRGLSQTVVRNDEGEGYTDQNAAERAQGFHECSFSPLHRRRGACIIGVLTRCGEL